jgi:hypothetical protein
MQPNKLKLAPRLQKLSAIQEEFLLLLIKFFISRYREIQRERPLNAPFLC